MRAGSGGRPLTHWTPAMDAALVAARTEGRTQIECAHRLGLSRPTVHLRMVALGLPTAHLPRIQWTPEMDEALIAARARGDGQVLCAERIGVDHKIVHRRMVQLGLPTAAPKACRA